MNFSDINVFFGYHMSNTLTKTRSMITSVKLEPNIKKFQ